MTPARRRLRRICSVSVCVAVVTLTGAACSGAGAGTPAPSAEAEGTRAAASVAPAELQVFAAASLKGVLEPIVAGYEAAVPGTTITVSTDASSALAAKIEQGAPADVFLSADMESPQALIDSGFAAGRVTTVAANLLAVIVPASNPAGISSPADLATPGLKIVAAGDEVPITGYAAQLVANLATEAGYPADFGARYEANVVSREDNVAAIVAKIGLAEADAGIVYATDAEGSDAVTTIDVPPRANVPATYGGVVLKASRAPDAAAAFLDWVAGPHGQAILASFGFQPAP